MSNSTSHRVPLVAVGDAWIVIAIIAVLFFLPSKKPAVILLAFDIAGMVWAFARVDAWALALVPLVPLGVALFLGVASDGRRDTSAST